jgi:cell division protein FtsW
MMKTMIKGRIDQKLLLSILFLLGLGLVQVYSSSYIFATENFDDGLFFFRKQFLFVVIAAVLIMVLSFAPLKQVKRIGLALWGLAFLGVLLTYIPGVGVRVGGAHRWLQLPLGFRFEPAELLRVTYPFVLGMLIVPFAKGEVDRRWYATFAAALLPLVFLLKQPDFGSFVICVGLIGALLIVFGLRWRYIIVGMAAVLPALTYVMMSASYRMARLKVFLNPWSDPSEKGFQVIQSLLSFYNGGLSGVGLGLSQGKLFFLPEAHTDFTLAVLGEEMGFVGFLVVMLIYGFIVFRGFQLALKWQRYEERAVTLGLVLIFSASVMINTGVALGVLPTKGLTLPMLSYGGSSLICTSFLLGSLICYGREAMASKKSREFVD